MKSGADIFVGIHDLVEIRRHILYASRESLKILKAYEQYKHFRTEKLQQVIKLYRVLSELSALNRKLKSMLPKIAVEEQASIIETPIFEGAEELVLKPAKSKLEILEDELAVIEQRLSALS